MARRPKLQALVDEIVMAPGPKLTIVRIFDEEGEVNFSVQLKGMPICPRRNTYAEIRSLVERTVAEYAHRRQRVKLVLWDGTAETELESVPADL